MKTLALLVLLVVIVFQSSFGMDEKSSKELREIKDTWTKFAKDQLDSDLKAFHEILSRKPSPLDKFDFSSPYSSVSNGIYNQLNILAKKVDAENRDAVAVSFKLFRISDGAFSEDLDFVLGELIRKNPKLFLQEYEKHSYLVKRIGALIGNTGIIDDTKGHQKEMDLRLMALKSVKDKNLKFVSDIFVGHLENWEERDRLKANKELKKKQASYKKDINYNKICVELDKMYDQAALLKDRLAKKEAYMEFIKRTEVLFKKFPQSEREDQFKSMASFAKDESSE